MTPQEFAASIKTKYPQYAQMDDMELAQKIVAKFPQYQTAVQFDAPSVAQQAGARLPQMQAEAQQPVPSVASEFMTGTPLGQIATGVGQGVGSTVYNLGKLAHHLPGMNVIAPDTAGAFSGPNEITQALEAKSPMARLGKTAEQIGEFFIPGASEAGALGPVAKLAGKAGLVGRMATEAAAAGTVNAAHGESPVAGAIAGGVAPAIGAAAEGLAPKMLNSLLGAKSRLFKTGANAGKGIVDEGIVAPAMSRLPSRIKPVMDDIGKQIGTTLALSPRAQNAAIDATQAIDGPIDKILPALNAIGDTATVSRLESLRTGLYDAFTQLKSSASAATPAEVWTVKKLIDPNINYRAASDTAEATTRQVIKAVRRGLADAIDQAVPDVVQLNKRYANVAAALDAANERLVTSHGLGPTATAVVGSIGRNTLPLFVGGETLYHTRSPMKAIAAGAATKALTSTPMMTGAAQALRGLGQPAVQRGLVSAGLAESEPDAMSARDLWEIIGGRQ